MDTTRVQRQRMDTKTTYEWKIQSHNHRDNPCDSDNDSDGMDMINKEKVLRETQEKIAEGLHIMQKEGQESGAKYIMEALQEWMDTVRYAGETPMEETKRLFTKTRFDRSDVETVGGVGMAYRGMVKAAYVKTIIWEKRLRNMANGYNTYDHITHITTRDHPMGIWGFIPTNDRIPTIETREEVDEMAEEILLQRPLVIEDFIQGFALSAISLDGKSRAEMTEILGPWPKPEYLDREINRGEEPTNRLKEELR